jgi:cystathionine beta-lyase
MDVLLAEPVAEALRTAIERGDTGYPAGRGYARAFSRFAADRWNWAGAPVERTAVVPDVMAGIVEVVRLITERGDAVVVNSPVYPPFYAFVAHDGRRVVEAPLGDDARVDLDVLDATFAELRAEGRNVAFLLCNPHNPTGVVHTRTEIEAVAALARRHGVRVVADEIHGPLVLPGATFTPYLSVDGAEDAFAVTSASKAWNLAGLKAALVLAGEQSAPDLARMPEEVGHGPSHVGVIAHTAAFALGGEWLDALLDGLDSNRALLADLIATNLPQVGYRPPEGTYLAWLDCRPLGLHDPKSVGGAGVVSELAGPARVFLDEARVALSSGHVFGTGGAGHVRLNFATSPVILTDALTRMGDAISRRGRGTASTAE